MESLCSVVRPAWRWAAVLLAASLGMADDLVQTVDMYRAMQKPKGGKETNPVSNNNLADVMGVLRYVHQEVIVEHVAGDPERTSRKYNIDSFAHYRMKVRNPDSILKDPSKLAMPGFGRYGAFDYGVATSLDLLESVVANGDYVGISKEDSPQINFTHPWYWFSVDGECPNLPWQCVKPFPECTAQAPPTKPSPCDPDGCAGKQDKDAQTCSSDPHFSDPTDTDTARQCCLHYSKYPDKVIMGGLCNSSAQEPTGDIGCVYNYQALGSKDFIMIDDLNGVTSMPCGSRGSRKCTGWKDWRDNCYDPEKKFKKRFHCNDCTTTKSTWNVSIQETGYCVEYDLHPYCQQTQDLCKDPRCMALKPEEKETGLPFWQGKCDVRHNQRRAEAVATFFLGDAVKYNHWLVDKDAMDASPACASKDTSVPNQCTPNPDGGPYCTRLFGGVCSTCYIPGTDPPYPDPTSQPMCPWSTLQEKGNTPPTETKCKSDDPLQLCCLYGLGSCSGVNGTDGSDAELTARGYLLVARMMDNKEMVKFAARYVASLKGAVKNQGTFDSDIYSTWHYQPPTNPMQAWSHFTTMVNQSSGVDWHPSDKPKGGGGGFATIWIVLIVLVVLAVGGFAAFKYRQSQQARQPLLPSREAPQVQMGS
mmetsp:Transcript_55232/g.103555  ORF Transcript_55232/g.103555 Transcript_55232/m.103555 type:complete len:645 (-) Transcript_55232:74-2008(-)